MEKGEKGMKKGNKGGKWREEKERVRKSDDVRQKYYKTIRLSFTLMRMKLK